MGLEPTNYGVTVSPQVRGGFRTRRDNYVTAGGSSPPPFLPGPRFHEPGACGSRCRRRRRHSLCSSRFFWRFRSAASGFFDRQAERRVVAFNRDVGPGCAQATADAGARAAAVIRERHASPRK